MTVDWEAATGIALPPLRSYSAGSTSAPTAADAIAPEHLVLVRASGHAIQSNAPLSNASVLDTTVRDDEPASLVAYAIPGPAAFDAAYRRGIAAVEVALQRAAAEFPAAVCVQGGEGVSAASAGDGGTGGVSRSIYSRLHPAFVVGSPVLVRRPAVESAGSALTPGVISAVVEQSVATTPSAAASTAPATALRYDVVLDADGSTLPGLEGTAIFPRTPVPSLLLLEHRSFVRPRSGQAPFFAPALVAKRTGATQMPTPTTETVDGIAVPVQLSNKRLPGAGGGGSLHAFGGPALLPSAASIDALFFLPSLSTAPFGMPFVLPVLPGATTGDALYTLVAQHSQRFIRLRLPVTDARTLPPGASLHVSTMVRWGFTLRRTSRSTGGCSRCAWVLRCRGCIIPPGPTPLRDLAPWESLAVEWDPLLLEGSYDRRAAVARVLHDSVADALGVEALSHPLEQARRR